MMDNSCEGYIELISAKLLHISCLLDVFVLLFRPRAAVTPSGNGRGAPLPSRSNVRGEALACPVLPSLSKRLWLQTENHRREVN